MSFDELLVHFRDNISQADWKKVHILRDYIDLKNVYQLLRKQPLDPRGNLTEKELDEAIVNEVMLPSYLFEHFEAYPEVHDQVRFFSKIFARFFREAEEKQSGFLKYYFSFERSLRLVLVGYRGKKRGIDLVKELQYEDPKDPFIAQILAQKDSSAFEFPLEFFELGELLKDVSSDDPLAQYKIIARYRFSSIMDAVQDHPFSIDYLLGYLIQFMMVEDWNQLDDEQGREQLNTIVKEVG